ncbi:MAG TPA: methyltransferase domain-containing protein, partial [Bacteroidetes bacterium]|nr:methyltransferase domain-containing protein [Bacteroidota bacterium]
MASLQKKFSEEKLKGQIFTPPFVVDKILNDIGFSNKTVLGKSILDPACGDGRFLTGIVERIIKFSQHDDLIKNLEFIEGWDIDQEALIKAKKNLDAIVEKKGIKVNWKLTKTNTLNVIKKYNLKKFDYIVGNPPYIRIQHIEKKQREFIQQHFKFCKSGSTDIYIAFFELALKLIKNDGVCGFITPNTFLHTDTAKYLRKFFEDNQNISQLTNYGHLQLFN